MKTPLFAFACAGIGAAGIFSYMQIAPHQAELDSTDEKKAKIRNIEVSHVEMQKDNDSEKSSRTRL